MNGPRFTLTLTKRTAARRPIVVRPIVRGRHSIVVARVGMAAAVMRVLPQMRHDAARQITAEIHRLGLGKLHRFEKADTSDVDRVIAGLDFPALAKEVPEFRRILVGVATDGIHAGFDQIHYDPDARLTDLVNERAVQWASDRAAEMVGRRYVDGSLVDNPRAEWRIDTGTRELLRGAVRDAIDNGTSTDDLAHELSSSYAFSEDRAQTIARTELAQADVAGNMIAYRDSGVVSGKEWALGSEHAEQDECDDAADMGVVDLDSDFGGLGDPPAHPNCVCDVLPVLEQGDAEPEDTSGPTF